MSEAQTTPGEAVTALVLDLFRLNNELLAAGDRLVAGLELTSARWQILGAIVAAAYPQPVAWLARNLGANRQNVQRIVNDLANDGLVEFEPNPHHRRAHLVVMTDKGRQTFAAAMRLQTPWIEAMSADVSPADAATAHRVILSLREKLGGKEPAESAAAEVG